MDFCCHIVDLVHLGDEGRRARDDHRHRRPLRHRRQRRDPDTLEVLYHYRRGASTWSGARPTPAATGSKARGWASCSRGPTARWSATTTRTRSSPRGRRRSRLPEKTLPRSPGHHREWLDAIKSRGRNARATSSTATGSPRVGHLGNIALWTGEKLQWDAQGRADHEPRGRRTSISPATSTAPPGPCRRSEPTMTQERLAIPASGRVVDDPRRLARGLRPPAAANPRSSARVGRAWIEFPDLRLRGYAVPGRGSGRGDQLRAARAPSPPRPCSSPDPRRPPSAGICSPTMTPTTRTRR